MEAINIYPELIKWKPNKQGLVPVAIRFDLNRQRVAYEQVPYRIKPEDWNPEEKKVKSSYHDHDLLNLFIENRLNQHRNFFLKRQTFNLPVTRELIKTYAKSGKNIESFYSYASDVIANKKLKDGDGYSKDTKRRYEDEIKRMMQFAPTLSFHQVNLKFLQDYKLWMQNVYEKKDKKKLHKNSIWKALAFIRLVYNEAIKDEFILPENNPFKKFEVGSFDQDLNKIKYLEIDQVEKIEHVLQTRSAQLEDITIRVGWRFLSMCVSGLRISDAMILDDMSFNDAGDMELTPYKTRRHGNKAHIPISTDRQRRYMQKTLSLPLPATEAKSFRTTFNIHLKVLCAVAEINSFTSHAGRHTMGSFLVDAGVQEKAAMAMLGVKSDRVIKTYMHLKESKLRSEADKLKNIF